MKKDTVFAFGSLALFAWVSITWFLFVHRPNISMEELRKDTFSRIKDLQDRVDRFDGQLKENLNQTSFIIDIIKSGIKKTNVVTPKVERSVTTTTTPEVPRFNECTNSSNNPDLFANIIPVLVIACNRVTVSKALESLLKARKEKDKEKFPIFVSQNCHHDETASVIEEYRKRNETYTIYPKDLGPLDIPENEKKFMGYFKIAQHYGWALDKIMIKCGYNQVIIVEDDLEVSTDFFEYFEATLPILRSDPTLWCVSAWNDNGKKDLIDETKPELLYRSDFFGGLGWMMTRDLWVTELASKWPKSYWDDWMRLPVQRKDRACIRPEIGRTKTFGKIGVSNGLFFDKHLKYIQLNEKFVGFKSDHLDLSYLKKEKYDPEMEKLISQDTPVANLLDVKQGSVSQHSAVRIIYRNKDNFMKIAKVLGIMDDFKAGVPRMAYKGVVSTLFRGQRVYVAPSLNWKGYDPSW